MKHFPSSVTLVLGGLLTACPCWAVGNSANLPAQVGPDFLMFGSQGYLGAGFKEIDPDSVSALHLKDNHAAEVTLVDHDAPAAKSGLKIHDVILQLDGQPFDNLDQLRRRLREMPAGRTISLLVDRDGNLMTITAQLCDRAVLGQQAWLQHWTVPQPAALQQGIAAKTFMQPAKPSRTGFLDILPSKSIYVGAAVNPVRAQLADYFGVLSGTGLLVESVDYQSPAGRAGLKAGDVVVKVESQPMKSRNDWMKAIRSHRGQPVQVTVMRNKQEQILTLTAGKSKNK
jgi:serine protease Do